MVHIPRTEQEKAEMLRVIGVEHFDDLLADVPEDLRLKRQLDLPPPLSEEVNITLKPVFIGAMDARVSVDVTGNLANEEEWKEIPLAITLTRDIERGGRIGIDSLAFLEEGSVPSRHYYFEIAIHF